VVCPANANEADACSRGEFDSLFHGTGSDDCAETVVPVHESGGCVCSHHARHRACIYYVFANAFGIDGKANHAVGIDTAQIGEDQAVGYFAGVLAGYIQFFQYRTTELVQIFGPVTLPFRHWRAFPPGGSHLGRFRISIVVLPWLS
jgi:hypothetical protein